MTIQPDSTPDLPSDRAARRSYLPSVIAVGILSISIGMVAFSLASLLLRGSDRLPNSPSVIDVVTVLGVTFAFPIVGTVVAILRPRNPIGWVFLVIGTFFMTSYFSVEYVGRAIYLGADLPAVTFVAWVSQWGWTLAFGLALTWTLLLFPDGRLPGRAWRPVAWAATVTVGLGVLGPAFRPGPILDFDGRILNPVGIGGPIGQLATAISDATLPAILVVGLLSFAGLLSRFRRAEGVERQQLKWFLFAATVLLGCLVVGVVTEIEALWTVTLLGLAAVPIAAGMAILRYRLYDIDVIIRRTLIYAALSAVLAAIYGGAVLVLTALLAGFAGGNTLAIAASTLAVAAGFQPARRIIQSAVDRRFFRSRYDATTTVDALSGRLLREVDLERVTSTIVEVIDGTLRPTSVSVWMREGRP
jgi:hypothetical protein